MECLVKNGSIYYEIIGEGKPLIILHAMGTDHGAMKAWVEPIFEEIDGWKRIYVDLPAHGKSQINDQVRSSDDILENLLEFFDIVIQNQSFSLLAMSYGAYLAQGIFHNRTTLVDGVGLIAPALHKKERKVAQKVVLERDEELLSSLEDDLRSAFETLMVVQNKRSLDYFLNEIQPGRMLANREFLQSNWREKGYFFSCDPLRNIEDLTIPFLIVTGKQDSICGYEDQYQLVEKLPHTTTFVVLDGAGHMLQIEQRELVQALVKDWVLRII